MNTVPTNGSSSNASRRDFPGGREGNGPGEDTLRLIANLPAPDGLADRVKAELQTAPEAGKILMWRGSLFPARSWMYSSVARGAAAAAIVCVVAGGGWGIYSRVQPGPSADVIVLPRPAATPVGGFSTSGATRVPETPQGVKLTHPLPPTSAVDVVQKAPGQPKAVPGRKAKRSAPRRAQVPVQ